MKVKTIIIIAALLAAPTALAPKERIVATSDKLIFRIHFDRVKRRGRWVLTKDEVERISIDINEDKACKLNDKLTEVDEGTCQLIESVDTKNKGIGVFVSLDGHYQLKELTDTNKPNAKCAIIGTANTIISFDGRNIKVRSHSGVKLRTELPGDIAIHYSTIYEETNTSGLVETVSKDYFRRELEKIKANTKGEATDDEIKKEAHKILADALTSFTDEKDQRQLEIWWRAVLNQVWPDRFNSPTAGTSNSQTL